MSDIIQIGGLALRFLQTKHGTGGSLDLFEMTVQPKAQMPVPHYHENWDETVYGLVGTMAFRIDGVDVTLSPGQSAFIRRGVVHGFENVSDAPATCLVILSPGVLGPEYFEEMAKLASGGRPDPVLMRDVMQRFGLIPVPT